ncbi:MAG: hypothetical protein MZV63_16655 [Marinilabiliales bacterium]|nr:hypothetical protein [Marinilabiliales bacterium]
MVYPDGEVLTYKYNLGGLLQSMSGIKDGITYNYLPKTGYNKFERRAYSEVRQWYRDDLGL